MNKLIIFLVLGFLIVVSVLFFSQEKLEKSGNPEVIIPISKSPSVKTGKTDHAASFAIFTNGTFRVFTASMYHNLSQDVFIEANNPNIVNVKKSDTTWNDFFATLPFKLDKNCLTTGTGQTFCTGSSGSLRFYLNGKEDANSLDKIINEGDKLLVTFGNETDEQINLHLNQIPQASDKE